MTLLQECNCTSELNAISLKKHLTFSIMSETDDGDFIGYILIPTEPYVEKYEEFIGVKIPFSKVIPDDGYEQFVKDEISGLTSKELHFLIVEATKRIGETNFIFSDLVASNE